MDPSALDGRSMGDPTLEEKAWEPSFEEGILAMWKAEPDLYRFAPPRGQSIYVIDTPPPYPSGSWHVGAVMAYSMIDMLARAQRMLGRAVLFPFGLDRNGINIERTVERKTGKPLHGGTGRRSSRNAGRKSKRLGTGSSNLRSGSGCPRTSPTYTTRTPTNTAHSAKRSS